MPKLAQVIQMNDDNSSIEFSGNQTTRKFNVYWRTRDMLRPQLLYTKTGQEMACVAQLVPTFEPPAPQEDIEVMNDEEPI